LIYIHLTTKTNVKLTLSEISGKSSQLPEGLVIEKDNPDCYESKEVWQKKIRPKMLKIEEDDYGIVNEWSNPEDQWVLMSDQDVGYCNPCCQLANGEISAGAGYPVVMKD